MSDEEIIKRLVQIQFKENLNQLRLCKMMNISCATLCSLLNGKRKLSENRRRLCLAFIQMYESGEIRSPVNN